MPVFLAYYIVVALFTFWAVSTHQATRGKPFVALLSAAVMPFTLPLIPVIGLVAFAFSKLKGGQAQQESVQPTSVRQESVRSESALLASSRQPGFAVGDERLSVAPKNDAEVMALCTSIAQSLPKRLPTEQDNYWFVVEQYDRLFEHGGKVREILSNAPLFPLEYSGSRSETSYVGKPNPGVVFLDEKVMPPLEAHFGNEVAQRMRATIYVIFRDGFKSEINRVRIKYAAHYQNNCVSKGSWNKAEEWDEVIAAVESA